MIKAVVIVKDEFDSVQEFATEEQLIWYRKGFCCGAELYGAGSCHVLTLVDLESSVRDYLSEKVVALVRKHLLPVPKPFDGSTGTSERVGRLESQPPGAGQ